MSNINHIDFRRFDLNLLVAFDALLTARSVTGAASRMGIGQPAMSHALNRLRELFDDPLFLRAPRGLEPTARALEIAEVNGEILRLAQQALSPSEVFVPATAERTLRLATQDYGAVLLVPKLLAAIQQQAPNVTVIIRQAPINMCMEALDRAEVDILLGACAERLPGRFIAFPVLTDEMVVIVRGGHPALVGREQLDLETFLALPHLVISLEGDTTDRVDLKLAQINRSRRVMATVPYFLAAPLAIAQSDMVTTLSRGAAMLFRDLCGLILLPPPLALPGLSVSAVMHRRSENDVAVQWFCQQILSLFSTDA